MDPTANLTEQLELATDIINGTSEDALRLAELVLALHQWIAGGGNRDVIQQPKHTLHLSYSNRDEGIEMWCEQCNTSVNIGFSPSVEEVSHAASLHWRNSNGPDSKGGFLPEQWKGGGT